MVAEMHKVAATGDAHAMKRLCGAMTKRMRKLIQAGRLSDRQKRRQHRAAKMKAQRRQGWEESNLKKPKKNKPNSGKRLSSARRLSAKKVKEAIQRRADPGVLSRLQRRKQNAQKREHHEHVRVPPHKRARQHRQQLVVKRVGRQ